MDDKEIREKAVLIAFDNTGYADKIVEHLSDADLLMTADALEAMEACVRFKEKYLPMSREFVLDKDVWMRVWDAGARILAKREQGPRWAAFKYPSGWGVVYASSGGYTSVTPVLTESQANAVADALNKHAGEK